MPGAGVVTVSPREPSFLDVPNGKKPRPFSRIFRSVDALRTLSMLSLWSTACTYAPARSLPSNGQRCVVRAQQGYGSGAELEQLLKELEDIRDWVKKDVAAAAMQATREKRSLDTFITELQDEVSLLGQDIDFDFELVAQNLEEQSEAMADDKRTA